MEFINKNSENVYITRYYPSKHPRTKYKKGDVIRNYHTSVNYFERQIVHIIEYEYKRFYFVIFGYVEKRLIVIDSFDTIYHTRDEAIDKFLEYCKEKNYRIVLEIK